MRLIVERKFGHMVTYQPPNMDDVPIIDAHQARHGLPELLGRSRRRGPSGISFGDSCTELPFKPAAHKWQQTARMRNSTARQAGLGAAELWPEAMAELQIRSLYRERPLWRSGAALHGNALHFLPAGNSSPSAV